MAIGNRTRKVFDSSIAPIDNFLFTVGPGVDESFDRVVKASIPVAAVRAAGFEYQSLGH